MLAGQRDSLTLTGRGAHTIAVRGRLPIVSHGADREVTLSLDPLPMARLSFTADSTARSLSIPTRQGSCHTENGTIDAELGSSGPVVVRWRSGGGANNPARVTASAATIWDIANGDASVTAAFAVRVEEGSLMRLAFEIPAALEPGRTTIRTSEGAPIGIRNWRLTPVENGRRTFTVLLQEPLEGSGSVILRLVPVTPLKANPHLTAVKLASIATGASYLAVRTSASVERWERVGFQSAALEAVQRDLGSLPELGLERQPPLLLFRRDSAGDAWVRPIVLAATPPRPVTEEMAWRFGAKATVDGQARFGKDVSASAVAFEVPSAVTISELQAAEVAGWSKQGSRVKVWFRSPQRDIAVKWYGNWSGYPKLPAAFDLPQPPTPSPRRIVRLQPTPGYDLKPTLGRWQPVLTFTPRETALLAPAIAAPLRLHVAAQPK